MKNVLEQLIGGQHLTASEAYRELIRLSTEDIPVEQVSAFLAGMQVKGLQLDELLGFQQALLELSTPVNFGTHAFIDVCGTGGDGKDTFNISTVSAFVLASMGFPVVKHGNYGVSSRCGSSNVLSALGIRFSPDVKLLERQLTRHNLAFLHAPLFHPALSKLAPVRKSLGIATFFNDLGPLVNPSRPAFQLTGTNRLGLARMYAHVLQDQRTSFFVVHGMKGYDEVTFDGATRVLSGQSDFILTSPPDGSAVTARELSGGSIEESAATVIQVLSGKGNVSQNAAVAGNVALGMRCFNPEMNYSTAYHAALDHLLSGQSLQTLKALQA